MMQPAAPLPPSTGASLSLRLPPSAAPAAKPKAGETPDEEDEYTQKLEEELAKYG
jgi:hypothetical protein